MLLDAQKSCKGLCETLLLRIRKDPDGRSCEWPHDKELPVNRWDGGGVKELARGYRSWGKGGDSLFLLKKAWNRICTRNLDMRELKVWNKGNDQGFITIADGKRPYLLYMSGRVSAGRGGLALHSRISWEVHWGVVWEETLMSFMQREFWCWGFFAWIFD